MSEINQMTFSHKEIAEILLKSSPDIKEGHWGIYVEFGIQGANISIAESNQMTPAAIVPLVKIGIQRFKEENPLTVDAAKINRKRQD